MRTCVVLGKPSFDAVVVKPVFAGQGCDDGSDGSLIHADAAFGFLGALVQVVLVDCPSF
jgi:hypothetical protein